MSNDRSQDYLAAKKYRSRGLLANITQNLQNSDTTIGGSIGRGISQTFGGYATGLKEKFDPLNIARMFTGNIGTGILGKMAGRSEKDIRYFTGLYKKPKVGNVDGGFYSNVAEAQTTRLKQRDSASDVAVKIYSVLKNDIEQKKLGSELERDREKEAFDEDKRRHQEFLDVLEKMKKSREKIKEVKVEKPKGKEEKKPTQATKPAPKPAPKPAEPTKAPAQKPAEAPKPPEAPKPAEPTKAPAPKPAEAPKPAPKPAEAPITVSKPAPTPPRVTASKVGAIRNTISRGAGLIGTMTAALVAADITNTYAQNAILANIGKETGFKPRTENLTAYSNTSNQRIREVFPSRVTNISDDELNRIKKDEVAFGEFMYGNRMGNNEPGDGYKYRGRGSIQLTGKDNYRFYSKIAGVDLVNNPDAVNDPQIDAKIVAAFIKNGSKGKLNFTNQAEADRAITQIIGGAKLNLNQGYGAELLSRVNIFSSALSESNSSGTQLTQASIENRDLKGASSGSNVIIDNSRNNIVSPPPAPQMLNTGSHDLPPVHIR